MILLMWSGPQAFLVLTFPSMSITSPNLILSGWISGSKGMTFWKFSLALAMDWSNSASTSVFSSSSKTLFSISLVNPFQLGRERLQFLCRSHWSGLYPTIVTGDKGRIVIWSWAWLQEWPDFTPGGTLIVAVHFPAAPLSYSNILANSFL